MSSSFWSLRLVRPLVLPLAALSERLGNRFYIGLALVLAVIFGWAILGNHMGGMKHQAYDLIMKHRFRAPAADPAIVIVDVDEASLAAMAPEYGRWPWARSVLAETLEGIARQQPQAVVFDITFSDLDVYNPAADAYFRDAVKAMPNSYFTMIRLNPDNDRLSQLRLAQLAGVRQAQDDASDETTVAMVVPYFYNVLDGMRLGTNNLYSDDDGIVRRYHVYRNVQGWRIGSLPANVAEATGATLPSKPDIFINWRGQPGAYTTVSFHELYTDLLRAEPQRSREEFRDKIVIIGSTAPSLFDIKPTPMAQLHPGVEVLATALDNMKNGDALNEAPRAVYLAVTLVLLAALAAAFIYNVDYRQLRALFTGVQSGILAVSYLVLNYSTLFVDLTGPFTAGLIFFTIASVYTQMLTMRRNGHPLFATTLDAGSESVALLLYCRLHNSDKAVRARQKRLLANQVGRSRYGVPAATIFKPAPLLHAVYRDRVLAYWLVPATQGAAAMADLLAVMARVMPALEREGGAVTVVLHAHAMTVDARDGQWRDQAAFLLPSMIQMAEREAPQGVEAVASTQFIDYGRAHAAVDIPAAVVRAGLHW